MFLKISQGSDVVSERTELSRLGMQYSALSIRSETGRSIFMSEKRPRVTYRHFTPKSEGMGVQPQHWQRFSGIWSMGQQQVPQCQFLSASFTERTMGEATSS